jgi:hypothetical protein
MSKPKQKLSPDEIEALLQQPTASASDTGAILDIGETTVYERIRNKQIPTVPIDGMHRIPTAWIKRVLGLQETA